MRTSHALEASDAHALLAAAEQAAALHGDDQGPATVSVALVDSGGHLLLFSRLDGASPASGETAIAKARMAALNRKPTADQERSINAERPALLQLSGLFGQPAVCMTGGLPLLRNGTCLGAVGVSGMTPSLDLAIAEAAATAFQTLTE